MRASVALLLLSSSCSAVAWRLPNIRMVQAQAELTEPYASSAVTRDQEGAVVPTGKPVCLLERSLSAAKACSMAFVPPESQRMEPYAVGLTCIGQFEDPGTLSGATLFTNANNEVIIACRGSANLKNFQTNLDIGPVPLSIGSAAPSSARVHAGFQKAADNLWRQIQPSLPADAASRPLLVTGHSLGGGVATLMALHARAAGLQPELITVAGPRLGNGAFAQHFREQVSMPATHLEHDDDAVLTNYPKIWDELEFEHVGTVVRCDKDSARLFGSDETNGRGAASCAPAAAVTGPPSLKGIFVDHCQYLGLYIGVRLEHPSVWLRKLF